MLGTFGGALEARHIDASGGRLVADVVAILDSGSTREITFDLPVDLSRYCVEKGSITIDGVSLTCASATGPHVRVALIPHTLEVTTLGARQQGDMVNIETDILGKYVQKFTSA